MFTGPQGALIFDPDTKKIDTNNFINEELIENAETYSSALLPNGNVLVLYFGCAEIFNHNDNKFYELRKVRLNNTFQEVTPLKDGTILLTGGSPAGFYFNYENKPVKNAALLTIY